MNPQLKKWIFGLLLVFGVVMLVLVSVYFGKRSAAQKEAEDSIQDLRKQTKPDGTPVLPPVMPGNSPGPSPTPGNAPVQPPVTNEVSSQIEKLCWMTDAVVKTGGTSVQRCEVCNNLDSMGEADLQMWAKTYLQWYGRSLKTDLSTKFFDCGCVPFFCSCSEPEPQNVTKLP